MLRGLLLVTVAIIAMANAANAQRAVKIGVLNDRPAIKAIPISD